MSCPSLEEVKRICMVVSADLALPAAGPETPSIRNLVEASLELADELERQGKRFLAIQDALLCNGMAAVEREDGTYWIGRIGMDKAALGGGEGES